MVVMRYLNQFQLSLHKITIMTTSLYILLMSHLTFSMEEHGHAVFQLQDQKYKSTGPEKRTHLSCHGHIEII